MTAIAPATTETVAGADLADQATRRPLLVALTRHLTGAAAAGYLIVLITTSAAAGLVAPDDPAKQDLSRVLTGPSSQHWLGTDRLGRDVLSRLMFGARVTLLDVALAVAVLLAVGIPLGVLAGYRGGWFDRVVVRLADLVLAVPGIVVLLMVVAIFPSSDAATMIALGVLGSPLLFRIVRGATIAVRGELYVRAAQLSGLGTGAILRRHILPRTAGPIIVQTSLFCVGALLAESGLSFLGLTRPETRGPSWGNMVAQASTVMSDDPWLLIPTGGALVLTAMAFAVVGGAVHDATVGRSMAPAPLRRRRIHPVHPRTDQSASAGNRPTPILAVRGLTVSLGGVPVLREVSFEVGAGETVGIVGESGCGKSITAKAVLGLLPAGGDIVAGSVCFDGRELTELSARELQQIRGAGLAFISQDPANSLDPTFTVASHLREVIRRHHPKTRRRQADAEAERLLRLVRIPDPAEVLRRRPHQLSGGMAQRVSIAMALAGRPAVLIADEPTTALDVTVQAEILALLRDLQQRFGMAVLLITHDWGVLADMCERAVVMYAGEVVETATVDELYIRPRHPYTAALLAANPHRARTGQPLPSVPGTVPRPGHWPQGCHFSARCPLSQPACRQQPITLASAGPHHVSRCIRIEEMSGEQR
jgi:peptide/nickel transport system permease protein